ncbi:MAG: acyltransferase family protein [Chloroflexota bacterium]
MSPSAGALVREREHHRTDIEGLRGIAVLLVVLFHAGPFAFTGGFIGVDVFFVVSGFLITGLLLRARERDGRIGLTTFYARRMRRLLPAGAVVIVVTLLLSIVAVAPLDLPGVAIDGASAALSVSNLRFASQGGYFDAGGAPSPFLHFWSLSVEEQFYLFWPVLLVLVTRMRRPRIGAGVTLAVIAVLSFAACVLQTASDPNAAFYLLHTRAWELALGGLLTVAWPALDRGGRALGLLGWAGLVAVLAASVVFDESTPWPGTAALLPVLGTVALLASGTQAWGPGRLLSVGPLRFVGRVSYAFYLWHWPLLVLPAAWVGEELAVGVRLGLVGVAFLLACVSTLLMEEPIREGRVLPSIRPRRVVTSGLLAMGLLAGLALGVAAAPDGGWLTPGTRTAAGPDPTDPPLDLSTPPPSSDDPLVELPSDDPFVVLPDPSPTPAPMPSPTLAPAPTRSPTPAENPTPSPTPSASPTAAPTPSPTPASRPNPTATPTPALTPTPTPAPTATPTPEPTPTVPPTPTPTPTLTPSAPPTPAPTATPTPEPTPTVPPSATPTPTLNATAVPTRTPTPAPTPPPAPTPTATPTLTAPPTPTRTTAPTRPPRPTPALVVATATPGPTPRPTLPPLATPRPTAATPVPVPTATPIPPPGVPVIPLDALSRPSPSPAPSTSVSPSPTPGQSATPGPSVAPSASAPSPIPLPSPTRIPARPTSAPVSPTPQPTPRPTPVSWALPVDVRPSLAHVRDDEERLRADGCLAFESDTTVESCVYGDPKGDFTVALVGDSHAAHWFPAVERIAKARGWRLVVMAKVSCPFTEMQLQNTLKKRDYPECTAYVRDAIDHLQRIAPDLVITTALRWFHPVDPADESPAAQGRAIGAALAQVPGRKVIIVDTPWSDQDTPACLSKHIADVRACAVPRAMTTWGGVPDREKAAAKVAGAALLDFTRVLCDRTSCPVEADGIIRYRDDHHFTETFARTLAPTLDRALQKVLAGG